MTRGITKLIILLVSIETLIQGEIFGRRNQQSSCENMSPPGKQYARDQSSHLCYPVGVQGPCKDMMIFYRNPSRHLSNYGFCDCDQGFKSEYPCKDTPIRKRLFIPSKGTCYTVFSQGPCDDGEWLIYDENKDSSRCVSNPCRIYKATSPKSNHFWFYDPERRQCFKTLTQGYCPVGFTLELIHTSQYPICKQKSCYSSLAHGIRSSLTCQTGSRFSYLTRSCTRLQRRLNRIG